ncbi:MAG: hypothetical protein KDC69_11810, partial [Flavobacteriaceae bacterium]|nr:hypothetical protein [Flavobacteriaceae bacterium]
MKNWLIIINLLFFAPNLTFGQIAVRVFNFRPTGELGFVMKPTTSVEIAFQDRFSKRSTKRFRTGFSLQYISMKPRLDVFPVSGVGSDANGFRVLPGKQSFQKYAMIQMTGGMDYAFIHKEKLNVFAGFDIVGGMAAI